MKTWREEFEKNYKLILFPHLRQTVLAGDVQTAFYIPEDAFEREKLGIISGS